MLYLKVRPWNQVFLSCDDYEYGKSVALEVSSFTASFVYFGQRDCKVDGA